MNSATYALRGLPLTVLISLPFLVAGCPFSDFFATGGSSSDPDVANAVGPSGNDSLSVWKVVDTGQSVCYDDSVEITCPAEGDAFYGQDGQYTGNQPSYTLSGDGLTVLDNVTGLTWVQSPDLDGDGDIDVNDKVTFAEAQVYPDTLNAENYGGYSDWRAPTIKQLYSLIDFRGTDPPPEGTDTTGLVPFIDDSHFAFAYGDIAAGDRIIDSQWATSTLYTVDNNMMFGVNFADGRIKGYWLTGGLGGEKTFFLICVRGNTDYGTNNFVDNGDGTVTDARMVRLFDRPQGFCPVQLRAAVNDKSQPIRGLPCATEACRQAPEANGTEPNLAHAARR